MAVGDHIQHWDRMLAVRTPFFRSPSSHYRPFFAWSPTREASIRLSVYLVFLSPPPYRTKGRDRSRDLMTCTSFRRFCSATQFNEAKRWFESATVLCRFVPDGVAKAEKVRDGFHP